MATPTRKITITLDTYLSILAVVSSFCAIGITFYQAYLQRIQQYASVMPIVDTYNTSALPDGTSGYGFMIVNNGLGPAFIEEASFYYGGRKYHTVNEFEDALLGQSRVKDSSRISDLWKGRVIAQGERFSLIESKNRDVEKLLRRNLDKAKMQILYRSVYGERWRHTYPTADDKERNVRIE